MLDQDDETYSNLRHAIFRSDAKAGVKDIMSYLKARRGDPMLWPARPQLSIFGVKNCLGRLRDDISLIEVMTNYEVGRMIRIIDEALAELHHLRLNCPPRDLRGSLGNHIVSAYVTLHRPDAFTKWERTTAHDLEYNCLQIRDCIAMRNKSVHFERSTGNSYTRALECEGSSYISNLLQKVGRIRPGFQAQQSRYLSHG